MVDALLIGRHSTALTAWPGDQRGQRPSRTRASTGEHHAPTMHAPPAAPQEGLHARGYVRSKGGAGSLRIPCVRICARVRQGRGCGEGGGRTSDAPR